MAEVGAGIQLAPNAARVLARFGVLEALMEKTIPLERNSLRRYANNEELMTVPLMPGIAKKFGSPIGVIHRGDLQRITLESARRIGVDIRLGHNVTKADESFAPKVQVSSGEWFSGDVILAADGIKSLIRRQMAAHHGVKDHSLPTGDSAYRILIPREKLERDERALHLLGENVGMRWMGPGGHIMAYPLKPTKDDKTGKVKNMLYNMVLLHPSKPGSENIESWTNKGDKKEMMDFYSSWDPVIQDLLYYVPEGEVMEWTLNSHRPLPSWTEGGIALLGDACHPMLPYVAQGAAQAIEDSGVLAECFSHTSDVELALAVYEAVRKPRAEKIQVSTIDTRKALHLPDGSEQRARDEKIKAAAYGGENPDKWADTTWQNFMYGVDVMKDTRENWDQLVEKVEGHYVEFVMTH